MTTMRQSPPDTAEGDLHDEQCRLSIMRWNPGDRREREEELPSRSLPHIFPLGSPLEVSHGLQRWLLHPVQQKHFCELRRLSQGTSHWQKMQIRSVGALMRWRQGLLDQMPHRRERAVHHDECACQQQMRQTQELGCALAHCPGGVSSRRSGHAWSQAT